MISKWQVSWAHALWNALFKDDCTIDFTSDDGWLEHRSSGASADGLGQVPDSEWTLVETSVEAPVEVVCDWVHSWLGDKSQDKDGIVSGSSLPELLGLSHVSINDKDAIKQAEPDGPLTVFTKVMLPPVPFWIAVRKKKFLVALNGSLEQTSAIPPPCRTRQMT